MLCGLISPSRKDKKITHYITCLDGNDPIGTTLFPIKSPHAARTAVLFRRYRILGLSGLSDTGFLSLSIAFLESNC